MFISRRLKEKGLLEAYTINSSKQRAQFVFTYIFWRSVTSISWLQKNCTIQCMAGKRKVSWPWSYGSWIYNYLCNQWLTPLTLWIRFSIRWGVLDTTLCEKVCQRLATGLWFSPDTPVSSTNKTDRHDTTEILLKVAINTITLTLR